MVPNVKDIQTRKKDQYETQHNNAFWHKNVRQWNNSYEVLNIFILAITLSGLAEFQVRGNSTGGRLVFNKKSIEEKVD